MNRINLTRTLAASTILAALGVQPLAAQGLGGSGGTPTVAPAPKKSAPAPEIDKSRLPPRTIYQSMLDANKKTGWVAFRNFNGKQLVYFTTLQTLHCRLKEIRYSINNSNLDQRFELVKCNPYLPFSLPSDVKPKDLYLVRPLGSVQSVSVQVVWEDDGESENVTYTPCPNVGDASCAVLVE
ncbi:MAG TPA: hypothetical protein ENJ55_02730 [Rhizobiales bacterium]|nr:hypothetical protein [Hyphomicrobiales bacterium]